MSMTNFFSGGLLAASMLLGQQAGPPAIPAKPAPVQATPNRPILGWFQREDRPVMNRIQSWFKRDQADTGKGAPPRPGTVQPSEPPVLNQPPSNDFPRKMPSSPTPAPNTPLPAKGTSSVEAQPVQQVGSTPSTSPPATGKSPILPHLANKIGRDERFEWITGQFEIENGNYVLYYATPETIDPLHGRIVLSSNQVDMSQFRKGDLVSVRGQLVQRPAGQGTVTIYRVTHASLIK